MNETLDAAVLRRIQGMLRLAEAAVEAQAESLDAWQRAVEIDVLRNHNGLTNDDLRWLVLEGLAEQRLETTHSGSRKRTFRKSPALKLAGATSLVLSPKGRSFVRRIYQAGQDRSGASEVKPNWDPRTGEWTFEGRLIKHLRDDADTQRKVLDQCQTEDWNDEITSPFLNMPPNERSHYLRQVIHHLNTGQKDAIVKLSSHGKGRVIRWRAIG